MNYIIKFVQNEKFLTRLLLTCIIIQFFQIFYFNRSQFIQSYDETYWKDRFEHSQWQLPASERTIGDDGLFEYVGYTLAKGADPSHINPETGPLGKYFLGWSIMLFNNPLGSSVLFGLGALAIFYLLAMRLFNNTLLSVSATLILLLDPLFFLQLSNGWIDVTQLFFLLLAFYALFSIPQSKNRKKIFYILLSGFSLGLFSSIKFPVLSPFIFLLSVAYLLYHRCRIWIVVYAVAAVSGFLLPYTYYFILHPSPIEFFRLQKYILSFYAKSRLVLQHGAIWQILFVGEFPDLVTRTAARIKEWWILWPVISIFALGSFLKRSWGKGSREVIFLGIYCLISLIVFSFIPVYTRYLLLILPVLLLLALGFLWQLKRVATLSALAIIILYGLINSYQTLQPSLSQFAQNFYYNFSHYFFQDIYQETLSKNSQKGYTRESFRYVTRKAFLDAEIAAVKIQEMSRTPASAGEDRTVKLTYFTRRLGSFTQEKTIHFIKENGQWKASWDWNLILDGFKPGYILDTGINQGNRGSLAAANGRILAGDTDGYLVSVIPYLLDTKLETEMLTFFSKLTGVKPVHLQNAYLENSLPDTPVPLFTSWTEWNDETLAKLQSYHGVVITPYKSRHYSTITQSQGIKNTVYPERSTRIYSSYNYHGIEGLEKKYDKTLWGHDGGSILLKDTHDTTLQTIHSLKLKDGQSISAY